MPLEFAKTDVGTIEVENLIGRLEYGTSTQADESIEDYDVAALPPN